MPYKQPPAICLICQEKSNFRFVEDYKSKDGEFTLYECMKCEAQLWMPFQNPQSRWYDTMYSPEYLIKNIENPGIQREAHKKFLELYPEFSKETKILDIGCGTGEFIYELKKRGAEVWGIDFSKDAVYLAKRHFGLKKIYVASLEDFLKKENLPKFDFVTFFEVIEHLDNPPDFIENIKKILKPDGKIVLSTPSRDRILINLTKSWDFPLHHLSRWNEKAVSNLFQKIGYKVSNIYYVEQFRLILGALNESFRMGLVVKAAVNISKKETKKISTSKKRLLKIIHLGGRVKDYAIGGIPAFFLWLSGKITGKKNGTMMIVLAPEEDKN